MGVYCTGTALAIGTPNHYAISNHNGAPCGSPRAVSG